MAESKEQKGRVNIRGTLPAPARRLPQTREGKRVKPGQHKRLNVPCLGWIYSQATNTNNPLLDEGIPILIYWVEVMPPEFKKRQIFYSRLDEKESPLRSNASQALRILAAQYDDFNVHSTNTYRYFYAVPKIAQDSIQGRNFAGYNLWKDYETTSFIPSYIADRKELVEQKLLANLSDLAVSRNVLANAGDTLAEQTLYRNMVVQTCQPLIEPPAVDTTPGTNSDPVCTTKSEELPFQPEFKSLPLIADRLFWTIDVFLQYVYDNTFRNFQAAGYGRRLNQIAEKELRMTQYMLFKERGYGFLRTANAEHQIQMVLFTLFWVCDAPIIICRGLNKFSCIFID